MVYVMWHTIRVHFQIDPPRWLQNGRGGGHHRWSSRHHHTHAMSEQALHFSLLAALRTHVVCLDLVLALILPPLRRLLERLPSQVARWWHLHRRSTNVVVERRIESTQLVTPRGRVLDVVDAEAAALQTALLRYAGFHNPMTTWSTAQYALIVRSDPSESTTKLFFRQKTQLIHLLESFATKRGRFAIFLSSPVAPSESPGSRHIVHLGRLDRNVTLEQAMDMMLDLRVQVDGTKALCLAPKQVVYVVEHNDEGSEKASLHAMVAAWKRETMPLWKALGDHVLGGVVDTRRVLVLTTPAAVLPEAIDRTLGRNMHVHIDFGPLDARATQRMLEHYFQCTLDDAVESCRGGFGGRRCRRGSRPSVVCRARYPGHVAPCTPQGQRRSGGGMRRRILDCTLHDTGFLLRLFFGLIMLKCPFSSNRQRPPCAIQTHMPHTRMKRTQ
ncbi:Aste57867_13420 [Aphanomyces stellatus]|uniref:Aste57867_13420 protein n=1 Tax=Aphanomyces stellatus TaxID=120398 RepID=A0A485KY35_9STRA|nr:hypothetical protein As57867_013370 [Aphanomyces stellatus]VFT90259.1 Aste57867_13420 [Aphanomyces stellatus]